MAEQILVEQIRADLALHTYTLPALFGGPIFLRPSWVTGSLSYGHSLRRDKRDGDHCGNIYIFNVAFNVFLSCIYYFFALAVVSFEYLFNAMPMG